MNINLSELIHEETIPSYLTALSAVSLKIAVLSSLPELEYQLELRKALTFGRLCLDKIELLCSLSTSNDSESSLTFASLGAPSELHFEALQLNIDDHVDSQNSLLQTENVKCHADSEESKLKIHEEKLFNLNLNSTTAIIDSETSNLITVTNSSESKINGVNILKIENTPFDPNEISNDYIESGQSIIIEDAVKLRLENEVNFENSESAKLQPDFEPSSSAIETIIKENFHEETDENIDLSHSFGYDRGKIQTHDNEPENDQQIETFINSTYDQSIENIKSINPVSEDFEINNEYEASYKSNDYKNLKIHGKEIFLDLNNQSIDVSLNSYVKDSGVEFEDLEKKGMKVDFDEFAKNFENFSEPNTVLKQPELSFQTLNFDGNIDSPKFQSHSLKDDTEAFKLKEVRNDVESIDRIYISGNSETSENCIFSTNIDMRISFENKFLESVKLEEMVDDRISSVVSESQVMNFDSAVFSNDLSEPLKDTSQIESNSTSFSSNDTIEIPNDEINSISSHNVEAIVNQTSDLNTINTCATSDYDSNKPDFDKSTYESNKLVNLEIPVFTNTIDFTSAFISTNLMDSEDVSTAQLVASENLIGDIPVKFQPDAVEIVKPNLLTEIALEDEVVSSEQIVNKINFREITMKNEPKLKGSKLEMNVLSEIIKVKYQDETEETIKEKKIEPQASEDDLTDIGIHATKEARTSHVLSFAETSSVRFTSENFDVELVDKEIEQFSKETPKKQSEGINSDNHIQLDTFSCGANSENQLMKETLESKETNEILTQDLPLTIEESPTNINLHLPTERSGDMTICNDEFHNNPPVSISINDQRLSLLLENTDSTSEEVLFINAGNLFTETEGITVTSQSPGVTTESTKLADSDNDTLLTEIDSFVTENALESQNDVNNDITEVNSTISESCVTPEPNSTIQSSQKMLFVKATAITRPNEYVPSVLVSPLKHKHDTLTMKYIEAQTHYREVGSVPNSFGPGAEKLKIWTDTINNLDDKLNTLNRAIEKGEKNYLMSFSAKEIAQQIVLHNSTLVRELQIEEILQYATAELSIQNVNGNQEKSNTITPVVPQSLLYFLDFSFFIKRLVQITCVQPTDTNTRAKYIAHWLDVIDNLASLRDFQSIRAVVSALNSHVLENLTSTWMLIARNHRHQQTVYVKYRRIMAGTNNFNDYRQILDKARMPVIPLVDLFVHDLKQPNQQNSEKLELFKHILDTISHYQHTILPKSLEFYQRGELISHWLFSQKWVFESELMEISSKREHHPLKSDQQESVTRTGGLIGSVVGIARGMSKRDSETEKPQTPPPVPSKTIVPTKTQAPTDSDQKHVKKLKKDENSNSDSSSNSPKLFVAPPRTVSAMKNLK